MDEMKVVIAALHAYEGVMHGKKPNLLNRVAAMQAALKAADDERARQCEDAKQGNIPTK